MKDKKTARWIYAAAAAVMIFAFSGWYMLKTAQDEKTVLHQSETETSSEKEGSQSDIYVHVTGAVKNPGVIKLPAGSRVVDAIEACGGLTENADSDSVNLAAILEDENKICIYTKDAMNRSSDETGQSMENKININTATLEELKTLNGIGDVIGQNIIDYRETHGGFRSIEEIMEVDRIGEKLYEKIKEQITI